MSLNEWTTATDQMTRVLTTQAMNILLLTEFLPYHRFTDSPTLSPIHHHYHGYPHHHHCTLQIIQFTNRLWNTTKPHIFFHLPVTTLWLICLPYFLRIWNSFPFSEQFGTGTVGGSNSSKNVPCDAARLRYLPGAAKIFTPKPCKAIILEAKIR